jgi:hypothetical protein
LQISSADIRAPAIACTKLRSIGVGLNGGCPTGEWLNKRGYLNWDQRGQGEAIIAAINAVIGRQR